MVRSTKLLQSVLYPLCRLQNLSNLRYCSSDAAVAKRNTLFEQEQKRQQELVGRVEKIEVRYLGLPEDATLVMNRGLSTPYNCAQHLSEGHCKRSALALIDGTVPYDMHRPLPLQESCTLQLINFTVADPHVVNKAFWRTCSFMLGAALQACFTDEARLQLHSFPGPNIKSGSFVYDVVLGSKSWQPTRTELRTFSAEMHKLASSDLKIERLDVSSELALEIFAEARYKREQLPSIAQQNQGRVTLYRMGTHIDISRGPMVASSRFLGKCTVAAAHKLADEGELNAMYRMQGVGLPAGFTLDHVAYSAVEQRAKKLNPARLPNEPFEEHQQQMA